MVVGIKKIQYKNVLDNVNFVDFLACNIGDDIVVKLECEIENSNIATADNTIVFAPININTLDSVKYIYNENTEFISECRVGDVLQLTGFTSPANQQVTILEIVDLNTIRTNVTFSNATKTTGNLTNITQYKGLRYYYNFVENGNDYTSLIDDTQTQLATYNNLDCTDSGTFNLAFSGLKDWQTGNVQVTGYGISNGIQKFTITQNVKVNSLNIIPNLFNTKIELSRNLLDLSNSFTSEVNSLSNIGGYNENFKGLKSNYYIDSFDIDLSTNKIDTEITTHADLVIKCNNASFTALTVLSLRFELMLKNEADYQNNNLYIDNFLTDSVYFLPDNIGHIGSFFGQPKQVIKTILPTLISSSQINLSIDFQLGTDAKIKSTNDYRLSIAVGNVNLASDNKDYVNLLIQESSFGRELGEINLINLETVFIEHPYINRSYGLDTIVAQPTDDIVCNSSFYIDFLNIEDQKIKILNVKPSLVLRKTDQNDILLEEFNIATNNANIINYGGLDIQDINFVAGRNFRIPTNEIRSNIVLVRDYENDIGRKYYYALNYPFIFRYEYWLELALNNKPADIFDADKFFNGYTQDWSRLDAISGYSLVYVIETQIERLGNTYQQTFEKTISSNVFDSNTDWLTTTITTNLSTFIKKYENTEITATFSKVSGTIPLLANVCVVFWIETFEGLGVTDLHRLSSINSKAVGSWWVENNVTITSPSTGVYVAKANIDYTKLPNNNDYTIYARIYEISTAPNDARITNDDIIRITNDNYDRIIN